MGYYSSEQNKTHCWCHDIKYYYYQKVKYVNRIHERFWYFM